MAEFSHKVVRSNGINIHYVEQGSGPVVLLVHGFPETWYSWRNQIAAIAAAGFHVVAPDVRGSGGSDRPEEIEKYDAFHIVGDLVGLIESLGVKQVLLVGHDWGAIHAWDLCLFRPDLVKAAVIMSVPFWTRDPKGSFLTQLRAEKGEDFYMVIFQEPGRAEALFQAMGTEKCLWKMHYPKSSEPDFDGKYPHWISPDEFKVMGAEWEKTGGAGALNQYRCIDRSWERKAPWTNQGVSTKCLFIAGNDDLVMEFPGQRSYVANEFKRFVPNLEVVLLEGSHFIHQEKPKEVNKLMIDFFQKV